MAIVNKVYDVFVSHSLQDASFAARVSAACLASGLEPFTASELQTDEDREDQIRDALAESRALIAIISPSGLTASMMVEIGAAQAWNKLLFAIVTNPSSARLPSFISDMRLYPSERIDDAIEAIRRADKQLTEDDRALLAQSYLEVDVPVDQLALNPTQLNELVRKFNAGAGKQLSGERLLSELLRLRKQGKLSKLGRNRSGGRRKTPHDAA